MKKNLLILPLIIMLLSCMPEAETKQLSYQNIIILSDMSNRLKNESYPQKDLQEIRKIIDYFKNECVKPGEKIGDKSSILFSPLSENKIIAVDIDKIKDLADKQSFINSTGKYKNNGLENRLSEFQDSIKHSYNSISDPGLDLISMLLEKIENDNLIKANKIISDGIDSTYINFENHIYIFTDGYLEYVKSTENRNNEYYFGADEIKRVRKYCFDNKVSVKTALMKNKNLGIPIAKGEFNSQINLHIMETLERDKDQKYQRYNNSKGLRDNDILKEVWQQWAINSGFKSLKWNKY